MLTALALPQCDNDDNGGGGGGPPPITVPIYLWTTSCTVTGNMTGCSNTDAGRDAADTICQNSYAGDAGTADERTRIAGEDRGLNAAGENNPPSHRAVLADSNLLPQNFDIPNKENREIQIPDQTKISDNYQKLFDAGEDIDAIFATAAFYWTGISGALAAGSFQLGSHCDNWISASSSDNGHDSTSTQLNHERFGRSVSACSSTNALVCVSY